MPGRSQIQSPAAPAASPMRSWSLHNEASLSAVRPVAARRGGWRNRLAVASRVCAALFAGYLLAHATTAFLTLVLPFARVERVIAASLLSFAVWCAAAVYVFAVRDGWRAWWAPLLLGAVLLGIQMRFPELAARP